MATGQTEYVMKIDIQIWNLAQIYIRVILFHFFRTPKLMVIGMTYPSVKYGYRSLWQTKLA